MTVAITDSPPQFVKVLFGHERIAPDDSAETLKRVTAQIDEYNEEQVEKQVSKYQRMALALQQADETKPTRSKTRTGTR